MSFDLGKYIFFTDKFHEIFEGADAEHMSLQLYVSINDGLSSIISQALGVDHEVRE